MLSGNVLKMDARIRPDLPAEVDVSKRLQAMELNLLGSVSLNEAARALNGGYRKLLAVDVVSLLVFEREDQDFTLYNRGDDQALHIVERECVPGYTERCRSGVWVGRYSDATHARFFPRKHHHLKTVALLPLSRRAKIIGVLALGTYTVRPLPWAIDHECMNRLAAIVAVSVDNLYNQEHIRQISLRDPLTGLFNRRYFTEHLNRVMSLSARRGWPVCCIYLDIDHFKAVNDRFGHAAGDLVLRELGQRMARQLRGGEVFARMGGEEFCILLTETQCATGALVAERIRASIESAPFSLPDRENIDITVSCGVAEARSTDLRSNSGVANSLLDRADRALYRAKQQGRNRVVADSISQPRQ